MLSFSLPLSFFPVRYGQNQVALASWTLADPCTGWVGLNCQSGAAVGLSLQPATLPAGSSLMALGSLPTQARKRAAAPRLSLIISLTGSRAVASLANATPRQGS